MSRAGKFHTAYPWGKMTPGAYLDRNAKRIREAVEKGAETGFERAPARAREVVSAVRPLVEAMEYLSGAGFRAPANATPISSEEVNAAVESTLRSLGEFSEASNHTWTERYETFVSAVEALLKFADEAPDRGITGSGDRSVGDVWSKFDA